MISYAQTAPFITLTEEVEIAPSDAGYRQFKPGGQITLKRAGRSFQVVMSGEQMFLDNRQAIELRDWLQRALDQSTTLVE
jgi:hypothetical protein